MRTQFPVISSKTPKVIETFYYLGFYLKISKYTDYGAWGLYAPRMPHQLAGETSGLS